MGDLRERDGDGGGSAYAIAACAIVALGAALRFWGLDLGLPHIMARPDEEVFLIQSAPLGSREFNLGYAVYPHLYFYASWAWAEMALTVGRLVGVLAPTDYATALRQHPEHILLAVRVLSATASTATVALVLVATRRSLGRGPALVAALLLATNFLSVRDGHAAKPDAAMIFFIMVSLSLTGWLAHRPTILRGAVVGLPLGLGMGMKYPAVLALPSAAVAAWMGSAGAPGWRRWIPPAMIAAGVAAGVAFVATSPFLVFDLDTFVQVFSVFGSIFPQWFPQAFVVPDALKELGQHEWWEGFPHHASFSLRYGAGLLPALLAPFAVAWGLLSRRPFPVACSVYCMVSYLVSGISPMTLSRYMTPIMPAIAVVEAGLLVALARMAARRAEPALIGLAALVLVAEPLASSIAHDRLAASADTRVLAAEWLETRLHPGASVAVFGTRFWGYGEPTLRRDVVRLREEVSLAELGASGVRYVYTHDHPLLFSSLNPALLIDLERRGVLVAEFDPFRDNEDVAVFEELDAYYIPIHGFGAVDRAGPHVRIYDLGPPTG